MNKDYPYIFQKQDKKWNFDLWEEFIRDQIEAYVKPAIAVSERRTRPELERALNRRKTPHRILISISMWTR
jgi:hypothetical protein